MERDSLLSLSKDENFKFCLSDWDSFSGLSCLAWLIRFPLSIRVGKLNTDRLDIILSVGGV